MTWQRWVFIAVIGLALGWLFDFVARVRLLERKMDYLSKGMRFPTEVDDG